MTSTPSTSGAPGTDDHPDVAEISALTEGILASERSALLQTHFADCELCADVRASLEEIRDALGTLPGPVRMPADIEGRIDAALAAEALLDASPSAGSAVSRETERTAMERAEKRAGSTREGGNTHDAGDVRHTGAAVSRETSGSPSGSPHRPDGHPGGATGPGRHRPARRTRRWRTALLAGAGAVVLFGIGGVVMESLNSSSPQTTASDPQRDGHRTAADSALGKRVHGLLAEQHSAGKPTGASQSAEAPDVTTEQSPGNNPLAGAGTTVPSCVRAGMDRTESPLAVDENVPYKGGTGYLVVLPHPGDPQRVDAYVVDRSCVSGEATGPAKILTTRTYPRH